MFLNFPSSIWITWLSFATSLPASPWLVAPSPLLSNLPQALCFTNQTYSSSIVRKIAYAIWMKDGPNTRSGWDRHILPGAVG
jgi:hypothetical protein